MPEEKPIEPNQTPPPPGDAVPPADGTVQPVVSSASPAPEGPKKKLIKKADPPPPPKVKMAPPKQPFTTIVLGETEVGKTYVNIHLEIMTYVMDNLSIGKKARKVLIYDVNNDYHNIRTLKATPEAILAFVKQPKIEARRIIGRDPLGRPLSKEQNYENAKMIIENFVNGLVVFDDIDRYAVHSTKQDLVSMLMGNRHMGCHILISHQAWRKMSVTECENCKWIRLHRVKDQPISLPLEKQVTLPIDLCQIANLMVQEQYDLAHQLYDDGAGELSENKFKAARGFFVYIDVRLAKLKGCTEETYKRAAYKYMYMNPPVIKREVEELIMFGKLDRKLRNEQKSQYIAMASLYAKYRKYLVLPKAAA